jgi:hypothetical protein
MGKKSKTVQYPLLLCVCVGGCGCVFTHAHTYKHYIYIYIYIYIYTMCVWCVRVPILLAVLVNITAFKLFVVCMYIRMYVCIHTYWCMYVCIHVVHVCTCIYTYIHTCMYVYIYMCVCITSVTNWDDNTYTPEAFLLWFVVSFSEIFHDKCEKI